MNELDIALEHANGSNAEAQKTIKKYQQQIKDLSLKPNPCCIEELDIASSIAIFHGHWSTLNRTSIVSAFSLQLVCPYPVLMSLAIPNTIKFGLEWGPFGTIS